MQTDNQHTGKTPPLPSPRGDPGVCLTCLDFLYPGATSDGISWLAPRHFSAATARTGKTGKHAEVLHGLSITMAWLNTHAWEPPPD